MQKLSDEERQMIVRSLLAMAANPKVCPHCLPILLKLVEKCVGTDTVLWTEKAK
jgi:hypothetical protein